MRIKTLADSLSTVGLRGEDVGANLHLPFSSSGAFFTVSKKFRWLGIVNSFTQASICLKDKNSRSEL